MRLNATSTTAATAISDAIVMPVIVVIGMAALRRMCRWITLRAGMPRLTAVCTCSRSPSSRIEARVTRATIASDEMARAIAGSVKCRMLLARSVPLPRAGNQRSLTANSRIFSCGLGGPPLTGSSSTPLTVSVD